MWLFKPGAKREMMERDRSQREEILGGLQHRIAKERSILQRRLNCQEPGEEHRPIRLRTRGTGRLYAAFQALGEDD